MYEYENRLKTFTKWPFIKNCKCTPENVSLKWIFWLCLIFYISCLNVKSLLNIFMFKKSCELPLSLKKKLNTPTFLCSLLRNTVVGWLASACSVHWSSYRIDYSYLSCFHFFGSCHLEVNFLYYLVFLIFIHKKEAYSRRNKYTSSRKDEVAEWSLLKIQKLKLLKF